MNEKAKNQANQATKRTCATQPNTISGAIFDMDGTLLDSMGAWHTVAHRYLLTLGIKTPRDYGHRFFSVRTDQAAEIIVEEFHLALTPEEVTKGMNDLMEKFYLTEAQPKEGAAELLEYFAQKNIPMVIGTSTDRYCVEGAMNRLGLSHYFKGIFTCKELQTTKSEPKLFETAAACLGSDYESTWVFEDGLYSIKAANALGMKTVGVFDEVSIADQPEMQEIAHLYLAEGESLEKLTQNF